MEAILRSQQTKTYSQLIHIYYTKRKGNPGFKKRVTSFEIAPLEFRSSKEAYIVECFNQQPWIRGRQNAMKTKNPYVGNDPDIIEEAYELLNQKNAMDVTDQISKDESLNDPQTSVESKFGIKSVGNRPRKKIQICKCCR